MSLEDLILKLTDAIHLNTVAHQNLADVAAASLKSTKPVGEEPKTTKSSKATEEPDDGDDDEAAAAAKKAEAAKKRKEAAAAKKAEAEKAEAEKEDDDLLGDEDGGDEPELTVSATKAEALAVATAFLGVDDKKQRDANKANLQAAFAHLGVTKIGGITSDEDFGRLVTYLNHFSAGKKVKFRELDERIADAS